MVDLVCGLDRRKIYRQSEWNDITVSGEAGGLRFGYRRVGGNSHYRSIGPWMRTTLRPSKSVRLDLPLSAEYRRHDDGHDRWRVTSVPRLLYALDGQIAVETEPILETVGAKTAHHRYRLPAVFARFRGRAVRRPFRRIPAACRPRPAVRQETVRQENPVEREDPAPSGAVSRVRPWAIPSKPAVPTYREYWNRGVSVGVTGKF